MNVLRLKHLPSQLKNMPAPLMKIMVLMKMRAPGLMKLFQPMMKLPGQPLVLRLKNKPGQLKHLLLRLKKMNQFPLLLLHQRQVPFFLLH